MANVTTAQNNPVQTLKAMLNAPSVQEQFHKALKDKKDAFISSIIDLYSNDTNLQKCDPKKVCLEALKAATLDLPVNKALGFSYILSYGTTPTFIVGYKGYIQLAQRTGKYRVLNADVIYEGELDSTDKLTGEIRFNNQPRKSNKIIGYFAHFELINGFAKTLYMTVDDMVKYAKRYAPMVKNVSEDKLTQCAQDENPSGTGWLGNFKAMALKTVLRQLLSKYGVLSIEMQNAIETEYTTAYQAEGDKPKQVIDVTNLQPSATAGDNNQQTPSTNKDLRNATAQNADTVETDKAESPKKGDQITANF